MSQPHQTNGFSPAEREEYPPSELVRGRQVLVVSNRQPYRHSFATNGDGVTVDRPTGGLTAGLDPVMQQVGGTWIAWGDGEADREVVGSNGSVAVPPDDPGYDLRRVWLSPADVRDYYHGFSNRVLWPICHGALTEVRCEGSFWERYQSVNDQFASVVAEVSSDRPVVWFQDYHLALAPRLTRGQLPPSAVLFHFWHIPWPAWDTFRACPHARELLWGLLGNDVIGFHVPRYQANFLHCVDAAFADARVDYEAGEVRYRGSVTAVSAHPMGVPFDDIQRSVPTPIDDGDWSSFADAHDVPTGTRIVAGVDRLDYSKGIVERLRALERLLEAKPGWRGALTYVQVGTESRSRIPAYQAVQSRVAEAVDRINRRFATATWQPVVFTTDHVPRSQLFGLYRRADVAIVSPLRDGMNLVAQEYIAAQRDEDGVLVLSDQAGFHDIVGDHVVSITPADIEGFATGIERALTMPPGERRSRMERLREVVSSLDLDSWVTANFRTAVPSPPAGDSSVTMA